jgi:molybdate transport system ATP-binding protein
MARVFHSRAKMTPFLSMTDASFRLGDHLVFENTFLDFFRNQHWAVVGRNGSGKSLFGDALRGRLPLVNGDLRYHFKPAAGLSHEDCIGHVSFEDRKTNVHDTVVQSRWNSFEEQGAPTVREFLSYEQVMDVNPFEVSADHAKAKSPFERRFRRAISLLEVQQFLARTLLSLSNGETQRVQLARELCRPLRLLILDEPFNGLDAATREHFRTVLDRLMQTPLRVLLITARIEEIPGRVSDLLLIDGSQVVVSGSRKHVLSRPEFRKIFKSAPNSIFMRKTRAFEQRQTNSHATGEELVRLRNVTVRYGTATILNGINWTVRAGESWALLGPNGSGKTTLLSLIQGDNPQAYMNDIVVFGKQRGHGESIWEIKRSIGWVSPELHVHFNDSVTCLAVVESGFRDSIGLFEPATPKQRATSRRWLKEFQLLDFANEPLFALSAGLQRMILLARALVKNPRLLILDEPCQGLDAAHRDFFVSEIDALLRCGSVTAIYVTHRPEEIPRSIKRVMELSNGKGKAA